jgi:hypothetical protein
MNTRFAHFYADKNSDKYTDNIPQRRSAFHFRQSDHSGQYHTLKRKVRFYGQDLSLMSY